MKTAEFDIKLEEKDYQEFNVVHVYKGKLQGKITILCGMFFLFIGFIGVAGSFSTYGFQSFIMNFPTLFTGVLLLLLFPIILRQKANSTFRGNYFIPKTQRYYFSELGLNVSSESGNTNIRWDEIYRVVEYKNLLLIFILKDKAYIIPKRLIVKEYKDLIEIFKTFVSIEKLKLRKQK